MSPRLILLMLGCGLLLTRLHSATPPHVILMLADDMGWGDVGYHGSEIRTPNLDALAESGVRMERFYALPVCSPTRGALLTGRYPSRLGLQCGVVRPWAQHGLPENEVTLADGLRSVGYRTALVGKWHLGHARRSLLPTSRGFDQQYGHYNGALDYFSHERDGGHDWHRNDQRSDDEGYTTDLIAKEAVRVIREHDASKPLFLYVPFNAPHTPLQVPEKWLEPYEGMKSRDRRVYAGMVACMDDAVGSILKQVRTSLPDERTLVIFFSDNGGIPKLGSNAGLRDGKGSLYEGGVRVPAIASWKGRIPPGTEVQDPLHMVDVLPTLFHLAGVPHLPTQGVDGRNIWPTLAEGKPASVASILLNVTPFQGALVEGSWKVVHNGHIAAVATRFTGKESWELFDLSKDPAETHNLVDENPEMLARLKARLDRYAMEAVEPHILSGKAPEGFQVPAVWGEGR